VALLGSRETVQGPLAGGFAELRLGPLVLGASGLRGRLFPAKSSSALRREAGEVQGLVRLEPVSWLGLEGAFTLRAFSSAAGYQRWQIPSAGIRLAPQLGHPALRAYARASYTPRTPQRIAAGQTGGDARWDLGVSAESGLVIALGRSGGLLAVSYRFERFDFPGGLAGRLDQLQTIAVSLGGHAGRP